MRQMNIIPYSKAHRTSCLEIIKSNTPKYFAEDETPLFESWLIAQEEGRLAHPVSEKEFYFVMETEGQIIGCAGYLLVKESDKVFLSWGMVHQDFHKQGFGKAFLEYRFDANENDFPDRKIALATTQDIAPFFSKHGFDTVLIKPKFYSPTLDRVEMERRNQ